MPNNTPCDVFNLCVDFDVDINKVSLYQTFPYLMNTSFTMQQIHSITIDHFKWFEKKAKIEIDNLSLLIGPNNGGKTTILHALGLWSYAIRKRYETKKNSASKEKRAGVGINIKDLVAVPVTEARQLRHNGVLRKEWTKNQEILISLALQYENGIRECELKFTYTSPDIIHCKPTDLSDMSFIKYASQINVYPLYTLSWLPREEKWYGNNMATIETSIAYGESSQVMRNICYSLYSLWSEGIPDSDYEGSAQWRKVVEKMQTNFLIWIEPPYINSNGNIVLEFRKEESNAKSVSRFDIINAGLWQNQTLLLLSYIYRKPGSVIVLDEPDAHLEILRQQKMLTLLIEASADNKSQFLICTHSEALINTSSETTTLGLVYQSIIESQSQEDVKRIQESLKNFGIEEYMNAKVYQKALYLEQSTDYNMLKELAKKLKHPVYSLLTEHIFIYYTQARNWDDDNNKWKLLWSAINHYKAVSSVCSDLDTWFKWIAFFDSDWKSKDNETHWNLQVYYWDKYELESYFIDDETLIRFAADSNTSEFSKGSLFDNHVDRKDAMRTAIKEVKEAFETTGENLQKTSKRAERVFLKYAQALGNWSPLRKWNFYELIKHSEMSDESINEIKEKLDILMDFLQ